MSNSLLRINGQDTVVGVPATMASGHKYVVPAVVMVDDEYQTVAASATNTVLGATGALGDLLSSVLIVPASTSPGAVSIKDGAGSAITIFAGGASSVSNLVPFAVPLGIRSTGGAWSITTGASVSVVVAGDFT